MWFAKPISALSAEEIGVWKEVEAKLPLAQSLTWARATEMLEHKAFLICSPEEKVGGIVFCRDPTPSGKLEFECINGPHLDWDDPTRSIRQFSTFAMAVAKLDRRFYSLTLKPRWEAEGLEKIVQSLPIELYGKSFAASSVVDLLEDEDAQLKAFSPRLQRNLKNAVKRGVGTRWEKATLEVLDRFVPQVAALGARKGFRVPDRVWFQALVKGMSPDYSDEKTDDHRFWLCTSTDHSASGFVPIQTQILVHTFNEEAHYLFGYDVRGAETKGSQSTAASAHWRAIRECKALGVLRYDLNGFVVEPKPDDPYLGVCEFKRQFRGRVVKYGIPEFVITLE